MSIKEAWDNFDGCVSWTVGGSANKEAVYVAADKLVRAVADLTAAACQTQAGGELLDTDPEAFLVAIVKAVKSGKEIDVDTMFDDVE